MNSKTIPSRIPSLDGLRGIAIFLVLLTHSVNYIDPSYVFYRKVIETGWNGVYLFFVLSGFLVGGLAFKELKLNGSLNVGRFVSRRFFRTWPLYFLLLALNYWRSPIEDFVPTVWQYLFFLQNYYDQNFFIPTWSLAVEEQFYFVLPLVLSYLAVRRKVHLILPIMAFSIIGAFAYRYYVWNGLNKSTFAVFDSIVVGLVIAYVRVYWPRIYEYMISVPHISFIVGLGFVYGVFFLPGDMYSDRFKLMWVNGGQALGFGLILISALQSKFIFYRLLSNRLIAWVGMVSYSIYLSHDRVVYHAGSFAQAQQWEGITFLFGFYSLYLGGSLLLGYALYFCIEQNGFKLREFCSPKDLDVPSITTRTGLAWHAFIVRRSNIRSSFSEQPPLSS